VYKRLLTLTAIPLSSLRLEGGGEACESESDYKLCRIYCGHEHVLCVQETYQDMTFPQTSPCLCICIGNRGYEKDSERKGQWRGRLLSKGKSSIDMSREVMVPDFRCAQLLRCGLGAGLW